MTTYIDRFLGQALDEGASEVYAVVVGVDGSASVYVGKRRPNGSTNVAGVSVRETKLGLVLDEVAGPLAFVASELRMEGFDDLPPEVKAIIHEHGNKAHRLYNEGYEAFDIQQIIRSEQKNV